jgi:hypothetical protein
MRSSEGAKAAVEAQQRAAKLEVQVGSCGAGWRRLGDTHAFGAGMDSRIGVADANVLVAFQTAVGRCAAAKAAVRKQPRATGSSSNGMAFDQVDVDTKEAEF